MASKEIVIIKNVHPNEKVAAEIADQVAQQLSQAGASVMIKDLLITSSKWAKEIATLPLKRLKAVADIAAANSDKIVIDFQDSPAGEIAEHFPVEPSFQPDTYRGYTTIELPAIYVSQTDTEITRWTPYAASRESLWFLQNVSDVKATMAAGLCKPEWVTAVTQQILTIAHSGNIPSHASSFSEWESAAM